MTEIAFDFAPLSEAQKAEWDAVAFELEYEVARLRNNDYQWSAAKREEAGNRLFTLVHRLRASWRTSGEVESDSSRAV